MCKWASGIGKPDRNCCSHEPHSTILGAGERGEGWGGGAFRSRCTQEAFETGAVCRARDAGIKCGIPSTDKGQTEVSACGE